MKDGETRDVETIEREIEGLKRRMGSVEGTPTEVYTRIVGYYRSLTNWNKGKREEYNKRRTFEHSRPSSAGSGSAEPRPGTTVMEDTAGSGSAWSGSAGSGTTTTAATTAVLEDTAGTATTTAGAAVTSYAYFFRHSCPNCPPVRALLESSALTGRGYDVDTEEGFAKASEMQIFATPTVIFFDEEDRPLGRAGAPADVRAFLSSAEE